MNKIILSFIISIIFMSCKKNYTCECITERRGFVFETTTIPINETRKSRALKKCKENESSIPDESKSCSIK